MEDKFLNFKSLCTSSSKYFSLNLKLIYSYSEKSRG
jgi:hypothetical protein